jgi:hypothetical protein
VIAEKTTIRRGIDAIFLRLPVICVAPNGSGLDGVRHLNDLADVAGKHGSTQSVHGMVRFENRVIQSGKLGNADDRSKNFFIVDLVTRLHIRKDRGIDEEAAVSFASSSSDKRGFLEQKQIQK